MKKKKVFVKRMRQHLLLLLILFTAAFVFLTGAIIFININKGKKYSQRVLNQKNFESIAVPFKRGDIFDRNGSILATSNKVYNLVIEPKNILKDEDKRIATTNALSTYFGVTAEEMGGYLADSESLYKVIRKRLPYEDVKKFQDFTNSKEGEDVIGIWFEDQYIRSYPNDELACHLLGFVVSGNEGIGGIEGSYNSYLNGQDGRIYAYLSEDYSLQKKVEPAVDGCSLVTTIDTEIQRIVQKYCDAYMENVGAKNVSVLVMNPSNCEVLALYNCHQYNPNDAYDISACKYQFETSKSFMSDEEFKAYAEKMTDEDKLEALNNLWRNFVISDSFEPGSTFKTFTIAGAIEDGVLSGDEQFVCDGHQQVYDYDISCVNRSGHGTLSVEEALSYSCNDCLMQIAALEGPTIFDKYQQLFGFGQRTNIDIPGEASSADLAYMIYHRDTLNPVELATSSFGQGVTVTMMQLGTAFCSAINGGYYYQPHVVKQIIDSDGNVIENYDKMLVRRTISEETSARMRDMLFAVVEEGSGSKAFIPGYKIGGKTGTAEKLPRGEGRYILSFIGFAPVDDPQVVVYCVVDEPYLEDQATSGAGAVLFNGIARELLPYMNIYKTGTYEEPEENDAEYAASPIFEGDAPENSVAGQELEEESEDDEDDSEDGYSDDEDGYYEESYEEYYEESYEEDYYEESYDESSGEDDSEW